MKKEPKYKVGDYLVADKIKFLEVVAVIDGYMPVYAIRIVRDPAKGGLAVKWNTEYELEEDEVKIAKPDFAAYRKLIAGDVLRVGWDDHGPNIYSTILSRVGNLVLISQIPKNELKELDKIARQVKELTDGGLDLMETLDTDTRANMKKRMSMSHTSKVAAAWMHVDDVCLFNWPIVRE